MSKGMRLTGGLAALVLAVTMLALAGCGAGFGPTLPSPNQGEQPEPTADICGTVTDSEDGAIAGATVTVSDGDEQWTATTDAEGHYCIDGPAQGALGVTVGAEGYETEYRTVTFEGEALTLDVVMDVTVAMNPADCPDIDLSSTDFNETVGTAVINGTVTNTDADSVILFQDGEPTITGLPPLSPSAVSVGPRTFTQLVFLHPGANVFVAMVANANCVVLSDAVTINWTPPEGSDFYFRVTLSWDTSTSDPDLHIWSPDPDNEHSAFWNKEINAGQLDTDDTEGFGPENFTCDTLVPGRFHVAVNSYSLDEDDHASCTVRVISGGLASNSVVRTYGPYNFTDANGEEGYPVTGNTAFWWRPLDIVVGDSGSVTLAAADDTSLTENTSGTPAQAAAAARSK